MIDLKFPGVMTHMSQAIRGYETWMADAVTARIAQEEQCVFLEKHLTELEFAQAALLQYETWATSTNQAEVAQFTAHVLTQYGFKVSVEGLGEIFETLYEKMMTILKAIRDWIMDFFKGFKGSAVGMTDTRRRLFDEAITRCNDLSLMLKFTEQKLTSAVPRPEAAHALSHLLTLRKVTGATGFKFGELGLIYQNKNTVEAARHSSSQTPSGIPVIKGELFGSNTADKTLRDLGWTGDHIRTFLKDMIGYLDDTPIDAAKLESAGLAWIDEQKQLLAKAKSMAKDPATAADQDKTNLDEDQKVLQRRVAIGQQGIRNLAKSIRHANKLASWADRLVSALNKAKTGSKKKTETPATTTPAPATP